MKKQLIGRAPPLEVYVVDGDAVRREFDMDYTQGGNHLAKNYVPEPEVWIDDKYAKEDWGFIIVHELCEHELMLTGMTYEDAHPLANAVELDVRKHPQTLARALAEVGFTWT